MSLEGLLTEPATRLTRTPGAEDDYGNATATYTAGAPILGRWEQRSSTERTQDRQTVVSDWVLYLGPGVVVGVTDRWSDQYGRVFEVVGAPDRPSSPTRAVYVEVSLRHVEG